MKDEFFIIHNSLICIKINSNIFIPNLFYLQILDGFIYNESMKVGKAF